MQRDALLVVHSRAVDVPDDDGWLGDTERDVLSGLQLPPRRSDWRLGRWTAKRAVSAWLGPSWPRAEIIAAADGAPEAFVRGRPAPVSISLTHRSGEAVCVAGAAGRLLGCDLEAVEPRSDAFLHDWFTRAEVALVEGAAPQDRAVVTSLVWSAKESALKVLREGMRIDTRDVAVVPGESGLDGWRRVRVEYAELKAVLAGWWRHAGDHVLTVVSLPSPVSPPTDVT